MKRFFRLIPVIAMLLCLIIIPLGSRADFGDYAGDSDYGDSGGWDSDWDSGSSWDDDDDWDSGSHRGHYKPDDGIYDEDEIRMGLYLTGGIMGSIALAVVFSIIFSILKKMFPEKFDKYYRHRINRNTSVLSNNLRSIYEYLNVDPEFSTYEFREKISNLYVRFQNEWEKKNIEPLRPYLTSSFFAQMDAQLDKYRQSNQTNHVDRIAVLDTDILGWKQESGFDIIVIRLKTRIVDYVTNDNTGAIVRGSNTAEKFMTYDWTLVRKSSVKTSRSTGTTAQTCPHCGAHIDINQNTVCEYCGSVLTTDTFDWAVSNIKGISQRTKK